MSGGRKNKIDELTKKQATKRAEKLRGEIARHNHRYYVLDDPTISDAEYDELKSELAAIEDRFPDLITLDSPTQRVGAEPREEVERIRHQSPMLSLHAVNTEEDFRRFTRNCRDRLNKQRLSLVAEPKFDGVSVEIVYDNGRFASAATRGDGKTGEDISPNVRTIKQVPLRLLDNGTSLPRHLVVRGEIYMNKEDLDNFNKEQDRRHGKTFANPRNAVAGSVRQLDPQVTAARPLRIFFWAIAPSSSRRPDTQWKCLELMKDLGLPVNRRNRLIDSDEKALDWHAKLEKRRDELDYEIDGCVFKVNNLADHEKLGVRAASPRWAIAYKFTSRRKTAKIEDIKAYVSRTGKLTPVAILEPVHIGGVEVSHVSLHNQDEVERKDVRIGDTVLVERAGDVIPHVVHVIKQKRNGHERKYHLPNKCPACDGPVVKPEGEAAMRCTNASCPAQLKGRIEHFGSPEALDIDGLGEKLVDHLVEQELVKSLADLFILDKQDLLGLERMGDKSARNLLESIRAAKDVSLLRLIFGLGIPGVGSALAGTLATEFGSMDALAKAGKSRLQQIETIGPTLGDAIHRWFSLKDNRVLVRRLQKEGIDPKLQRTGKRLEGKTLVITGSLESMNRDEAKEKIRLQGGRATSSVSARTDYLVVGSDPGDTKLRDARSAGVQTIDEKHFRKLVFAER